MIVITEEMTEN